MSGDAIQAEDGTAIVHAAIEGGVVYVQVDEHEVVIERLADGVEIRVWHPTSSEVCPAGVLRVEKGKQNGKNILVP